MSSQRGGGAHPLLPLPRSAPVMAAILAFQNNEATAMLVQQTNPAGDELFSYVNTLFCCNELFAWLLLVMQVKILLNS